MHMEFSEIFAMEFLIAQPFFKLKLKNRAGCMKKARAKQYLLLLIENKILKKSSVFFLAKIQKSL